MMIPKLEALELVLPFCVVSYTGLLHALKDVHILSFPSAWKQNLASLDCSGCYRSNFLLFLSFGSITDTHNLYTESGFGHKVLESIVNIRRRIGSNHSIKDVHFGSAHWIWKLGSSLTGWFLFWWISFQCSLIWIWQRNKILTLDCRTWLYGRFQCWKSILSILVMYQFQSLLFKMFTWFQLYSSTWKWLYRSNQYTFGPNKEIRYSR